MAISFRATSTCPGCGSDEVISVGLVVGSAPVRFITCHFCELRWWESAGQRLPLASVLTRVAGR